MSHREKGLQPWLTNDPASYLKPAYADRLEALLRAEYVASHSGLSFRQFVDHTRREPGLFHDVAVAYHQIIKVKQNV